MRTAFRRSEELQKVFAFFTLKSPLSPTVTLRLCVKTDITHYFPLLIMVPQQNILINSNGEPLLADFGLSKVCPSDVHRTYGMTDPCVRKQIMEDLTGMPFTQSRGVSDSYRWFAPELCCSPGILSTASDVFAYAMTVLEVCLFLQRLYLSRLCLF